MACMSVVFKFQSTSQLPARFVKPRVLEVLEVQSHPTLCDPMDRSMPGSSVHGILQARILEWVAIPFSRDLPNPAIKPRSPALQVDSSQSECWASLQFQIHNLHF